MVNILLEVSKTSKTENGVDYGLSIHNAFHYTLDKTTSAYKVESLVKDTEVGSKKDISGLIEMIAAEEKRGGKTNAFFCAYNTEKVIIWWKTEISNMDNGTINLKNLKKCTTKTSNKLDGIFPNWRQSIDDISKDVVVKMQ